MVIGGEMAKIVVAVCGSFDPFRIGHLEHIKRAKQLGDWLIVMINPDADLVRKRGNPDLVCQPIGERYEILKAIKYVDQVVIGIDNDGTMAKTILMIKPDILAKGGDRTSQTMPKSEIDVCEQIGCKIVYGIGDTLSSSTNLIKRLHEYTGQIQHEPSGDFK